MKSPEIKIPRIRKAWSSKNMKSPEIKNSKNKESPEISALGI